MWKWNFLINVVSFAEYDSNRSDFHLKADFTVAPRSLSHDVMLVCVPGSLRQDRNCWDTSLAPSGARLNKMFAAYVE